MPCHLQDKLENGGKGLHGKETTNAMSLVG